MIALAGKPVKTHIVETDYYYRVSLWAPHRHCEPPTFLVIARHDSAEAIFSPSVVARSVATKQSRGANGIATLRSQ